MACASRPCRSRAANADCSPTTERRRASRSRPSTTRSRRASIEAFPNFTQPENPLDCWAIDAYEHVFPGTLSILRETGSYDILLAQLDLSRHRGAHEEGWCAFVTAALADAVEGTDIFPAVTSVHATDPPPAIAELARARDVALLRGTREGLRAIAAVARWCERPPARPAASRAPPLPGDPLPAGRAGRARLVRAARALRRDASRRACAAPRPHEAASAFELLGGPVVVKLDGPAHKQAAGGVALGISSAAEARAAAERMGGRVLVARQVPAGVEAFCGLTRDPDYGPVLAVGLGGRAIEALGLAAVALAPLDDAGRARRSWPRRRGSRSSRARPAVDALAAALAALSRLASRSPGDRRDRHQPADPRRRWRDRRRRPGRREGSAMSEVVLEERRGPALWITMNRPDKLNALSGELVEALRASFRRAAADEEVKVVVLTGAGRAFSAGFDISEEVESEIASAERWHDLLSTDVSLGMELWSLPRPTIAAVRGWCLAGACELAMACDMIVAADDARFGEPEIRYGSGPVSLLMPFVLGQKKTNELLFTGDWVDAQEAERLGLVNRVAPADGLEAAVDELVAKIAPTPLPVLRLTKLALNRAYEAMGLRQAVNANLDLSAILNAAETPEQREFDRIVADAGPEGRAGLARQRATGGRDADRGTRRSRPSWRRCWSASASIASPSRSCGRA